jgi:site-specific DNA recombinase
MKKLNVGYMRVSTEAQTEKYGLDVQEDKIKELAKKRGVKIARWYVDGGYSGSNIQRPNIQKLLEDAEAGEIQAVYIYKLDRMSRDVVDTLTLVSKLLPKYNVEVVSATEDLRNETPMDRVMLGVNAVMGQYEREVIYMRTRAGMVERVKRGLWMGGGTIPYGYRYDRNDGILHIIPEEAEKVKAVFQMFRDGYSCDRIQKILGMHSEKLVSNIIRRITYVGKIQYKGRVYQGLHEPIIDEKLFYEVQEEIKKRSTNAYVSNKHMLTGLCYCGKCGTKMRMQKWGKYTKIVCYSQYKEKEHISKTGNPCKNKKVRADVVEKEVEDCFKRFIVNVEEKENESESTRKMIEKEISLSEAKLKRLYTLYASGSSGTDTLFDVIHAEEKTLKNLQEELKTEDIREKAGRGKKIEKIKEMSNVWDTLTDSEKNKVLKECVEKVVITGDDIDIHFSIY